MHRSKCNAKAAPVEYEFLLCKERGPDDGRRLELLENGHAVSIRSFHDPRCEMQLSGPSGWAKGRGEENEMRMPAIRDLIVRGSPRTAWDTDTFYAAPSRASDSESESGIFGLISVTSPPESKGKDASSTPVVCKTIEYAEIAAIAHLRD
ncbi:hypothetical protein BDR07DRAFT_1378533 [Suillus spraguei]|nr:hypothetical protein BDR07DRAFT_1378533 [Suillus spraguei]